MPLLQRRNCRVALGLLVTVWTGHEIVALQPRTSAVPARLQSNQAVPPPPPLPLAGPNSMPCCPGLGTFSRWSMSARLAPPVLVSSTDRGDPQLRDAPGLRGHRCLATLRRGGRASASPPSAHVVGDDTWFPGPALGPPAGSWDDLPKKNRFWHGTWPSPSMATRQLTHSRLPPMRGPPRRSRMGAGDARPTRILQRHGPAPRLPAAGHDTAGGRRTDDLRVAPICPARPVSACPAMLPPGSGSAPRAHRPMDDPAPSPLPRALAALLADRAVFTVEGPACLPPTARTGAAPQAALTRAR